MPEEQPRQVAGAYAEFFRECIDRGVIEKARLDEFHPTPYRRKCSDPRRAARLSIGSAALACPEAIGLRRLGIEVEGNPVVARMA
jgi:hypothetical protein